MQPGHQLGVLEHDLGHVGPGLQIAASLELEQVALGADDRASFEPRQQRFARVSRCQLTVSLVGGGLGIPALAAAAAYSSVRRSASTWLRVPSTLSRARRMSQVARSRPTPETGPPIST